jgi:predicted RNA-binding protein
VEANEARNRTISALLQAGGPLPLDEIEQRTDVSEADLLPVLEDLVQNREALRGRLRPDQPGEQYCWWACWQREIERRTDEARQQLRALADALGPREENPGIDSPVAGAFCDYVIEQYRPPEDKRLLVFLQCSVRRPFSSSPSHSSMRRAIRAATGFGPAEDFLDCPVHVVVLASKVGPVPYELQDLYPANVRSGGVKHFGEEHYARVKPVLADRMGRYVLSHRESYDRIATFTDGRYADVMGAAAEVAGVEFPILPAPDGPRVLRMASSTPRKYWEKYWIQLYLEIVSWLGEAERERAEERLGELDVDYA